MTAMGLDPAWNIPHGMPVYDIDGRRVGKVCGGDGAALIVERGLILRRDWSSSRGRSTASRMDASCSTSPKTTCGVGRGHGSCAWRGRRSTP